MSGCHENHEYSEVATRYHLDVSIRTVLRRRVLQGYTWRCFLLEVGIPRILYAQPQVQEDLTVWAYSVSG